MIRDPLPRAWALLIGLSLLSAALADWSDPGRLTSILILGLGLAKARTILATYLRLAGAPFWMRGADWVLALVEVLFLGLYIVV
ncbi:nitric oxide reductase F protein [Defluviimonas sp. D31]|uniref:nitric oxide reductase F protein n=1 Tax=Defluviimonas sp. D31 TaxID=3083253 RepID=UPI00296E688F|nr:nitric oxide reductase F protein [Defluviimonas sp. D31]MDW4550741.1 nitric oxide reductase F protein [Defluviimonas sp. D31]